jgi:hypothetical protein
VLLFLRPVSHNKEAISAWNGLVGRFDGKPVNFVWIANEKEESLLPFLKEHPVRGWMLLDLQDVSYRAYGVEGADGVLIDPNGVVAGFPPWIPNQNQIQAVMDNRAVAIQGEPSEEQLDAFFDEKAVRLEARPSRIPPPPQKPDLLPSRRSLHLNQSRGRHYQFYRARPLDAPWLRPGNDPLLDLRYRCAPHRVAADATRRPRRSCGPDIGTSRVCVWRWKTGQRNCG